MAQVFEIPWKGRIDPVYFNSLPADDLVTQVLELT